MLWELQKNNQKIDYINDDKYMKPIQCINQGAIASDVYLRF